MATKKMPPPTCKGYMAASTTKSAKGSGKTVKKHMGGMGMKMGKSKKY